MRHFVGFVLALNEAVKGRKLSDRVHESQAVWTLLEVRLVHCSSHVLSAVVKEDWQHSRGGKVLGHASVRALCWQLAQQSKWLWCTSVR